MLTLYQVEWCPHCHRVRQVLTELGLTFLGVNVPARREERADVVALSGDAAVPVLQDGDRVVAHSDDIIAYLRATYPEPDDADDHRAKAAYRNSAATSLSPRAAAARLKELLEAQGFAVLAEVTGAAISPRLPDEYLLLYASVPAAAVKAFQADPAAATAVALPFVVAPAEGGSIVAAPDPVGPVWIYGDLRLIKPLAALRERLAEVFVGL
jgi:glutathione S-transferase